MVNWTADQTVSHQATLVVVGWAGDESGEEVFFVGRGAWIVDSLAEIPSGKRMWNPRSRKARDPFDMLRAGSGVPGSGGC